MSKIFDILEELKAEPSKNAKLVILRKHEDDETLKRVFQLALDPRINFFIKKIPERYDVNMTKSLDSALDDLSTLSNRVVTGNKAIEHLRHILTTLSVKDANVVGRIIKGKLDCGVSESTVNKVWGGLIFKHPVMLASSHDDKTLAKFKFPAYAQLKADGARVNVWVDRMGSVRFCSRNGKEMYIDNPELKEEIRALSSQWDSQRLFDGEMLIDTDGDTEQRTTSNGLVLKAIEGTMSYEEAQRVRISIWDEIGYFWLEDGKYEHPYSDRFGKLEHHFKDIDFKYISLIESLIVHDLDQAKKVFRDYLADGQEGIILKEMDGIWEDKRVKHMIKFKDEITAEVRITDVVEGTGKHTGMLGAFEVESANGVKGKVGTGLSDEDRKAFFTNDMIGTIIEIKYNEVVGNKKDDGKSFFLPVFVAVRPDKTEPDNVE